MNGNSAERDGDDLDDRGDLDLVPYGPGFTPDSLGQQLGHDAVLPWLLTQAAALGDRAALKAAIATTCFSHIQGTRKNPTDMAQHIIRALTNYGLIAISGSSVSLSAVGRSILDAPADRRDVLFARHILTSCNGNRLLDLIREYDLRGERPRLEDLAEVLDRHPTAKNISSLRAWLARAGIFGAASYRIDEEAVERVLGGDVERLLGLSRPQLEFILAARVLEITRGQPWVEAAEAVTIAQTRVPELKIARKSLGRFVQALADAEVIEAGTDASGAGGLRRTFRLLARASSLADDELRRLLNQKTAGYDLRELLPLAKLNELLAEGRADERGHHGEMLAVHLCLMLGLRVVAWRSRAPGAEIDLIAERVTAMSYQRWAIQVKNVDSDVGADRVDREIGAVAGVGVSHILFVIPRASISEQGVREMEVRSRLTSLHIFAITNAVLAKKPTLGQLVDVLRRQTATLARLKQDEARRREAV